MNNLACAKTDTISSSDMKSINSDFLHEKKCQNKSLDRCLSIFLHEASELKICLFQKCCEKMQIFRVFFRITSVKLLGKYLVQLPFAKGQLFKNFLVKF